MKEGVIDEEFVGGRDGLRRPMRKSGVEFFIDFLERVVGSCVRS